MQIIYNCTPNPYTWTYSGISATDLVINPGQTAILLVVVISWSLLGQQSTVIYFVVFDGQISCSLSGIPLSIHWAGSNFSDPYFYCNFIDGYAPSYAQLSIG